MDALFTPLPSIREIAAGYEGPIIAAVGIDDKVSVWDLDSSKKLSEFESSWDIGGRRLAISDDGKLCAVGAYQRYGVTVFDALKGATLWRRRDLRKVQSLKFSRHRAAVLAGIDEGALHVVDRASGVDLGTFRGIDEVWESPFGTQVFKERRSGNSVVEDSNYPLKSVQIQRTSFGVLDTCFSPEHVAVSEAGGATSLYALDDGKLVWKYAEPDHHIIGLAYCKRTREIVGINYSLRTGGGTDIVALDLDTGIAARKISRDDLTISAFALEGSRVITWHGNVVDVITGEVVSRLDFHQT
jgi:WD40 repeat protein